MRYKFVIISLQSLGSAKRVDRVSGTPIPLDTHPPEHSSPWNTHPPPGTPIPLELPSPGTPIPPGTAIPQQHPSPHGTLIPPLIIWYYIPT